MFEYKGHWLWIHGYLTFLICLCTHLTLFHYKLHMHLVWYVLKSRVCSTYLFFTLSLLPCFYVVTPNLTVASEICLRIRFCQQSPVLLMVWMHAVAMCCWQGERRIFSNFHRQVFCWTDEWHGLTMTDIRALEDKTKIELDEVYTLLLWEQLFDYFL